MKKVVLGQVQLDAEVVAQAVKKTAFCQSKSKIEPCDGLRYRVAVNLSPLRIGLSLKKYVLQYKGSCDAQLESLVVSKSLFVFLNPGHSLSKIILGAFQHRFPRLRRIVWFAFTFERHARQVIKKIAISSSYQLFYHTLCSSDGLSAQKQLKVFFRVQDREKYTDT